MERNQEEARRKKMARLSTSSYVGGGVFVISQSPSSSDVDAGSPDIDVGTNANKSNIMPEQLERME